MTDKALPQLKSLPEGGERLWEASEAQYSPHVHKVLLPLSLTVITVVTSSGNSLSPESRAESPVPPPNTTIFFIWRSPINAAPEQFSGNNNILTESLCQELHVVHGKRMSDIGVRLTI